MPLDFQLVQAPMRLGLAEGVDPHQVPFGTLTMAENVHWTKSGRIEKRLGIERVTGAIVGGGTIGEAVRLITRGAELCLTDGRTLYSYDGVADGWRDRGRIPGVALSWTTEMDPVDGVKAADIAILSNGHIVETWINGDANDDTKLGTTVWYRIYNLASGVEITPPTAIFVGNVGWRLRVLASGTTWLIVFAKSTGELTTFCSSTLTVLQTDVAHSGGATPALQPALDACVIGTEWVVAYATVAGGVALYRYSFAAAPAVQASGAVTGETHSPLAISIDGRAGETLYLAYWDDQDNVLRYATANPSTLAQVLSPTVYYAGDVSTLSFVVHNIGVARTSSTTCCIISSFNDTARPQNYLIARNLTSAGVVTTGSQASYLMCVTRPFLLDGDIYVVASTRATTSIGPVDSAETLLLRITVDGITRQVPQSGKIEAFIGSFWCTGYVSNVVVVPDSTDVLFASPFQSTPAIGYAPARNGIHIVRASVENLTTTDLFRSVQLGPETYWPAGVLTAYDGTMGSPYGWAYGPQIDKGACVSSSTGGSMDEGSYIYNVTGERRSAVGILHRSPVGVPVLKQFATGTSTNKIDLHIVLVQAEYRDSTAQLGVIPLYRSVVGGAVLQRRTVDPSFQLIANSPATIPATTPFVATDKAADANVGGFPPLPLAQRPALYTEGGELEDIQPVAARTLLLHQNRLWMIAGDGRTLWFSKDWTSNPGIAPGFYPTQVLAFDRELVSLASLDEKLIVFSADRKVWYVVGNGPAPNGQGTDYQTNSIQTDVGCTNPRSVVATPDGVMFQSEKDIYLLDRALGLTWIGRPIIDELERFSTITSAVLVTARSEVRFTVVNDDLSEGATLVYNYVERQWTVTRYKASFDEDRQWWTGFAVIDAVMHDGVYTFVTHDGEVYTESTFNSLDDGTWTPLVLETAWLSAAGPLAFQSVRNFALQGVSTSAHNLTISVGFDNETTYAQTRTFAADSEVTTPGPLESCEITIGTRRKCAAIRFRIEDAYPDPVPDNVIPGSGPSIDMLGIEVGSKRGFRTKPAGRMG